METLNSPPTVNYPQAIEEIIKDFTNILMEEEEETEVELIGDRHGGHYLVMVVGWQEDVRVYNTIVHVDLKGDKIWIQKNETDRNIAQELVALGVAKTNIVLGDRPPSMRKFTPYSPG